MRPCITIRKETEWTETLKGGWNQLLYDDLSQLAVHLKKIPESSLYNNDLYGDGNASGNIADKLATLL
jgi:UDP-N-acetylglucosamine 2-epimerase